MTTPTLSDEYIVSSTNGTDFDLVLTSSSAIQKFPSHDSMIETGGVSGGFALLRGGDSIPILLDSGDEGYLAGAAIIDVVIVTKFWTGYVSCEE